MGVSIFKVRPLLNKINKQITISLPKRRLKQFSNRVPKSLKLKIQEVEW